MKTLIELYDERTIEDVIAPEVFQPEKVVYLCPEEIAQNKAKQKILKDFLLRRGLRVETEFLESSLYKSDRILKQLRKVAEENEDFALDVSGGTDAALVAAGMFCNETQAPTFTYSRRRNRFYDISNAPFADGLPCDLRYSVEDFFAMAGGRLREGRVDNGVLERYLDRIDAFFGVFLKYRRSWNKQITFFQRISQVPKDTVIPLKVSGAREQKGERGSRVQMKTELLRDLESIGFLRRVRFEGDRVSFAFADLQVRAWLRDVGSALELYMYKACLDAGIFHDVISSAIVDWGDDSEYRKAAGDRANHDLVYNEIDVVAARGVIPLFISCKACEVKTEALNELAILADRFGGKGAKMAIATTEPCNSAARHRAAQLGIAVIDLEELKAGKASERLKVILKQRESL